MYFGIQGLEVSKKYKAHECKYIKSTGFNLIKDYTK